MPHAAAGMRIEPPVSVPTLAIDMPVRTAIADPPLEPPGDRVSSMGCRASPQPESSRRRAERELVQVGAADEHRAGVRKTRDDRRMSLGDASLAQPSTPPYSRWPA